MTPPGWARWALGITAIGFGVATGVEGGHVLFGGPDARSAAGQVVPFVLWFNFAAGFVYLATGLATLFRRAWAVTLARALALGTLGIFAALVVHILGGGAYETRTVGAMTVRSAFWVVQALLIARLPRQKV